MDKKEKENLIKEIKDLVNSDNKLKVIVKDYFLFGQFKILTVKKYSEIIKK